MNAIASNITKIVLGMLIFNSIIVFSLVHLAKLVFTKMEGLEYSTEWQTGILSALILISIGSIRFILKGVGNGSFLDAKEPLETKELLNYQNITSQFSHGIIDGMKNSPPRSSAQIRE